MGISNCVNSHWMSWIISSAALNYFVCILAIMKKKTGNSKCKDFLVLIDADDTLWESALFFERTEHDFLTLMKTMGSPKEEVRRIIHQRDIERLSVTGYGARPYMDTLREIMHEFTVEQPPWALKAIDDIETNLLNHPVLILPGVISTLDEIKRLPVRTMVYTMGEENHQTDKFVRSGLMEHFDDLRIVPVKSVNALREILEYAHVNPENCIVAGNSPRSDINPALSLGACAVHIPRDRMWTAEHEEFLDPEMVVTINSFRELYDTVIKIFGYENLQIGSNPNKPMDMRF